MAAYGERNAAGEPLRTDTVMYAASLTKMAFGHLVAQLAQDARIELDASIATALDKPLPDYPPEPKKYADYSVLADDARWRQLTRACCSTIPVASPTSAFSNRMAA